jgi:hypothetical protein
MSSQQKVSASVRLNSEDHARASLVALVDRRSVSEIIAECVRRALPELEAELERPRLTPEMKRLIDAGAPVGEVIMDRLAPYTLKQQPASTAATNTNHKNKSSLKST